MMIVVKNILLMVLLFLYSAQSFSADHDDAQKIELMHFPCPKITMKKAHQNYADDAYWEFFYGPNPSRSKNAAKELSDINIPWKAFSLKLVSLAQIQNDEAIKEMESVLFANILTIQRANKNQYKRLRRRLNGINQSCLTGILESLENIRRSS